MASVDAHADALWMYGLFDQVCQVFETLPQAGSLAGGSFEQNHRLAASARLEQPVERGCLAPQPGLLARAGVRAGVRHQVGNAEGATALQLVGEGGDRLL